jgi:hypothetical protein
MNPEFKKGITTGLIIYGAGTLLTVILHLIYGWDSPHSPPTSFFSVFLTLAIGAIRLLITAFKALIHGTEESKGELMVHVGVGVLVVLFVVWMEFLY